MDMYFQLKENMSTALFLNCLLRCFLKHTSKTRIIVDATEVHLKILVVIIEHSICCSVYQKYYVKNYGGIATADRVSIT